MHGSGWMKSDVLTTYCPNEGIQNICQKLDTYYPYPNITHDSLSIYQILNLKQLVTEYFFSCVRVQSRGFCLYKPLTFSLPWNTPSVLIKSVSSELQFLRRQIYSFLIFFLRFVG